MTADAPGATTTGTLRLLWDGPVLYLLVEVAGDSTRSDAATPEWNRAAYIPESDGLFVYMDVFNDQWALETDTQGVFFLGANPALSSATSYNNAGIPSLGSFFHIGNQDHSPRLKAFKSSGYREGSGVNYTYELGARDGRLGRCLATQSRERYPDRSRGRHCRPGPVLCISEQGRAWMQGARAVQTCRTRNVCAIVTGVWSRCPAGMARRHSPTAAGVLTRPSASGIRRAIREVATPAWSGPRGRRPGSLQRRVRIRD